MPIIKQTPFVAFEFTPEELLSATVLPPLNYQYIQTLLSEAAEDKMNVQYDSDHPVRHIQQEAYFKGQIDLAKFLLGVSDDRKEALTVYLRQLEENQSADNQ